VSQALDVADAVETMRLKHAVITSVTRDDLPDGGASLFAETISRIHDQVQGCTVEVLIPDFKGNAHSLKLVTEARPEILAHNLETIPRLYPSVRPQADYRRSLKLLQSTRYHDSNVLTKSGIMVGLGENTEELLRVFADLRLSGCDILTVGQYLRPTRKHLPVVRYYTPEEFLGIREAAYEAGFRWVESGPLVRSSYHAGKPARELRQELDHKRP
jgi:lipoic acid synthetase